jgi:uncharacterized phage protein (TIGR01671 family)
MRDIEFRGKNKKTGKWVFGYLTKTKVARPAIEVLNIARATLAKFEIDPETVGEFTGLLDRNGMKIFEGDFIKKWICGEGLTSHYIVHYINCGFRIKPIRENLTATEINEQYGDGFILKHNSDDEIDFEVIGNIHDNPELLQGETA